jgi:hypothetical protein
VIQTTCSCLICSFFISQKVWITPECVFYIDLKAPSEYMPQGICVRWNISSRVKSARTLAQTLVNALIWNFANSCLLHLCSFYFCVARSASITFLKLILHVFLTLTLMERYCSWEANKIRAGILCVKLFQTLLLANESLFALPSIK